MSPRGVIPVSLGARPPVVPRVNSFPHFAVVVVPVVEVVEPVDGEVLVDADVLALVELQPGGAHHGPSG